MKRVDIDDFSSVRDIVEWYYIDQLSIYEIADQLGVGVKLLLEYMDANGLPRREGGNGKCGTIKGPPCPDCSSQRSKVKVTKWMPRAKYYRRTRRCEGCGRWFCTKEIVSLSNAVSHNEKLS